MSLQEAIVCCKVGNERHCCVCNESCDGGGVPLAKGKESIAEAARQSTLDILRDALKKKDRVLMETPRDLISRDSEQPQLCTERFAVLTEQRVRDLNSVLEEARFVGDPSREKALAWASPKSGDKTIYLGPLFWEAPSHLEEDSQPGTSIHEASHFLGARDITHEPVGASVACTGLMVKNSSTDPDSPDYVPLVPAVLNANNIESEFERTLRHQGDYERGRYSCCGETARSSVCEGALPHELLVCPNSWCQLEGMSIGEILREEPLSARDRLRQHVAALRAIADAVDEVHRGATIASISGGAVGIVGGITTVVGLCLAPVTAGASLIVSLVGLGVSAAGGLTSAAATTTDIVQGRVKKEIDGLLGQCQAELQLIQECMKTLCEKLQRDSESHFSPDLLSKIPQIATVAARAVLHTVKAVNVGKPLASAGRITRFTGVTAHVLTGLTLGLDIFFVAKGSVELHKGAKTELANKIREAVAELEQVNDVYAALTGEKPELDPEEY